MMQSVMEETRTMSRREAAAFLGVHYNTIRSYEERGMLTPQRVKLGGIEEVRYSVEEVRALTEDVAVKRARVGAGSGGLPVLPEGAPAEQRELMNLLFAEQSQNTRLRVELAQCEGEREGLRELVQELREHIATIKTLANPG